MLSLFLFFFFFFLFLNSNRNAKSLLGYGERTKADLAVSITSMAQCNMLKEFFTIVHNEFLGSVSYYTEVVQEDTTLLMLTDDVNAKILFPFFGNFLQNNLVFCIQSKLSRFCYYESMITGYPRNIQMCMKSSI